MKSFIGFITALAMFIAFSGVAYAQDAAKKKQVGEESLFLDLRDVGLGTISGQEEKRQYLMTIQLEKQRIQAHMLRNIYENAFALYKKGDYEKVQELAGKILAMDPTFQDASLLLQASGELKGKISPVYSERMLIEEKFRAGLSLYKEGRTVEAARKWEDVLKLSPGNLKAKYWFAKANEELAEQHYKKGEEAYSNHRLREALDQWYSVMLLRPHSAKLLGVISKVETELRDEEANEGLKNAIDLYTQGRLNEAYAVLKKVQEIQPGEAKVQKLLADLRGEIASGYVAEGRKAYHARQYAAALDFYGKAKEYGSDPKYITSLINTLNEQKKKDEANRKEAVAREQREVEEERRAAENERREAEQAKRDMMTARELEAQKKADEAAAASESKSGSDTAAVLPAVVTSEMRRNSQERYASGMKYYMSGNREKAKEEWTVAKQLDPGNSDAELGLKKIDQELGIGGY